MNRRSQLRIEGRVEVVEACTQRGWSSRDHMIDDSRIAAMVGRVYVSARAALEAGKRLADDLGFASVTFVYLEGPCGGQRWTIGGEPEITGREALCRRDAGVRGVTP